MGSPFFSVGLPLPHIFVNRKMGGGGGGGTFALCSLSLAVDLVSAAGGLQTAPGTLGASVFFMLGCLLPVRFHFFCRFPAGFFCWGPAVFFYSSSDAGGEAVRLH